MEQQKRTDINNLGEFALIDHLVKDFKNEQTTTRMGVGDDAAVIDVGDKYMLMSTDMLVEGIHFDLMYTPLKHLGYKAVISNLSDICAMNAFPTQITFSLAISNRFSVEALDELYSGIQEACRIYKVDLVGGDTAATNKGLVISVTAIGFAEKGKVAYRSGAKPGDILCVSGDLGAAYLGLQLLEREKHIYLENPGVQPDLQNQEYLVGRQLKPEARKDLVRQLAKANIIPTSMIDISDGLASETLHLCKNSNVGAFIEEANVPIHSEAEMMAITFGMDPITCALSGGEDYELLFTLDPKDIDKVKYMTDIFLIGEITEKKDGVKLHSSGGKIHDIIAQGWKHFG